MTDPTPDVPTLRRLLAEADFEAVMAAHDAKVGPISGYWTCACGAQSDNTRMTAGGPQPFDRRAEYRAHVATALCAALPEVTP